MRTTRGDCDICGKSIAVPHKWTFYFLMSVGFWNFFGAGVSQQLCTQIVA